LTVAAVKFTVPKLASGTCVSCPPEDVYGSSAMTSADASLLVTIAAEMLGTARATSTTSTVRNFFIANTSCRGWEACLA
jgi:hypothetical protein